MNPSGRTPFFTVNPLYSGVFSLLDFSLKERGEMVSNGKCYMMIADFAWRKTPWPINAPYVPGF
jgi:hypothetical protein